MTREWADFEDAVDGVAVDGEDAVGAMLAVSVVVGAGFKTSLGACATGSLVVSSMVGRVATPV